MARPVRYAVFAGLIGLAAGGAAVFIRRHTNRNQEKIMAKFEGLDTDIAELKSGIADATRRVEDAVERLTDDTADQQEIDEARAELREAIGSLNAIAAEAALPPPASDQPTEPA